MSEKETYNDFESLCAGYVLDALSDEERNKFEALLSTATQEQREIYEQMRSAKDEIALAAEPLEPSNQLFSKIISEINKKENGTAPKSASIIPLWTYKLAAAVFLTGFLALALFTQQLSNSVEEKVSQINYLQNELVYLESELEQRDELLAILESREMYLVLMDGLDTSPDGYGKILWDPEGERALLQVANLPQPADDKDYQLWLIKDEQSPVSAGIFNFERPGTDLFYRIDALAEAPSEISNTFAITLEPKGGVPQPTGEMYLVGQKDS